MNEIEKLIKRRLDRIEIDGFEPKHSLPAAGAEPKVSARNRPARSFDPKARSASGNRSGQARSQSKPQGRAVSR